MFFVLSGYLITWLLVHEAEETGTVDLVRFYARRARRLLPAVAVVLVATVAVGVLVLAPFEQEELAKSAVATAAYVSNVFFARRATDYLGAAAEDNPLLHTWSLSVEEQFYVLWPLFVLFAFGALKWQKRSGRRPSRRRLVGWMAAVAVVSFAASVYLTGVRQPWAFFLSPLRAWEFAAGALGMLVGSGVALAGSRRLNPGRVSAVEGALGWAGLATIFGVGVWYGAETPFPGVAALLPVVATVLVVRAGTANTETSLARVLAWRPFQEIGRLSYSWYLWHWPVLVYAHALGWAETLPARLGLLGASLVLAEMSYRFVEDPVRHHPALTGRARAGRSLAMAVVLTAVGVGLSVVWWRAAGAWAETPGQVRYTSLKDIKPKPYDDECVTGIQMEDLRDCVYGAASADTVVVLFGDSHAGHWFPAVEPAIEKRGWRLVVLQKSACAAADFVSYSSFLGRQNTECGVWREAAFDRMDALQPFIVLTSSENVREMSLDDWEAAYSRTFDRLTRAAEHVIHIQDTPRPRYDVPACLARQEWQVWGADDRCTFPTDGPDRLSMFALERRVAAEKGVSFASWNDLICTGNPCETVVGDTVIYRDSHHLATEYAASLEGAVDRQIDALLR